MESPFEDPWNWQHLQSTNDAKFEHEKEVPEFD